MPQLTRRLFHQYFGILALLFLLAGMVVSKAMMSMGMIGLAINWIINPEVGRYVRAWWRHPVLASLSIFFLALFVTGLWSEDTAYWVNRMRMKLPFLLMPAALLSIPRFDKQVYYPLLVFFMALVAAICVYLTGWYVWHFQDTNQAYAEGRVLPTPVMHIRFSLMVAYAAAIGISLAIDDWQWKWKQERWVYASLAVFLVLFLHILAVRSGLVAVYGMLVYFVVRYIVIYRRWWIGVLAIAGLLTGGVLAYYTVPSLQKKVDYTLYNLYHIRNGNLDPNLSDTHRIGTIHAGIHLGNTHFWTGVGYGDIREETEQFLQQYYPDVSGFSYTPQSQVVLVYAVGGIGGLLIFVGMLVVQWFYRSGWKAPLLGSLLAVLIPSFLVEQTLETQLGNTLYLVFLLMAVRYYQHEGDRR
ncbi:MAG: O-antigen ligase family protein [Saprospiraceae bacterium]